jgi:flagellar hook-length control protein FliK
VPAVTPKAEVEEGPKYGTKHDTGEVIPKEAEGTARITEFKIAAPPRAAYTNPFTAVRPVQMVPVAAEDTTTVWDLRETQETETVRAPEDEKIDGRKIDVRGEPQTEISVREESQAEAKAGAEPQTAPQAAVPLQTAAPVQGVEVPQQAVDAAKQIMAERIIEQIISQTARAQDISVLTMELQPKFLGKIQLIIAATADGMTARLSSDNGATRSILNEHLAELKTALREAGITMKDVEVSETRVGTQLSDRHSQQDNGAFAEEQKPGAPGKASSIMTIGKAEEAEQAAVYTQGRVTGHMEDTQFDYRA